MDVNLTDPTASEPALEYVPGRDAGRLLEAEHTLRYRWAALLTEGRRVLDAGSGAGHGALALAQGGAAEVIGVDNADGLAETGPAHPGLTLLSGDVAHLGFEDGRFDVVVAFELLEHISNRADVLRELKRVLVPEGLLLVATSTQSAFPAGDPRHAVIAPPELADLLSGEFDHVTLLHQHDYLTSAVFSDANFAAGDGHQVQDLRVEKLMRGLSGGELFTLAAASNASLPSISELGILSGTLDLREWRSAVERLESQSRIKDNRIAELEALVTERDALSVRLVDAEQRLASVPALKLQIKDLQYELKGVRGAEQAALDKIRDLDQRLMDATRQLVETLSSPSWRVTKPVRMAKRILRS